MNLQYLTTAYLKSYRRRLHSAVEINYGDCYRYAYLAHQLYGGQLITVTKYTKWSLEEDYQQDTSHAFIKKGGKYYDSESPQGVDTWEELHYFQRDSQNSWGDWYYDVKEHCSPLSFKRYWTFKKHTSRSDKNLFLKLKDVV